MANTLTISISPQDLHDLKQNPAWSASKIFRSAMKLQRKLEAFDLYTLEEYASKILEMQDKFPVLQKEILKREDKIESLKNVLEEEIAAKRRLRKTVESNSGDGQEAGAIESLRRSIGEQPQKLTGSS